ncbi:MAG TPA: pantoate--beta-alanine ligase, partial [Gammaproteobacteria bacterium]|nr:pantoate--beta-alanine ligase [Gammaproteobacteria bacterium]
LISSGFDVEYVSFRSMETLSPAAQSDDKVILLVAAWLGKTRLIDNLQLISRH